MSLALKFREPCNFFIRKTGIRHRWIRRGLQPEDAKTLQVKMKEWAAQDEDKYEKINIGFSLPGKNERKNRTTHFRKELRSNFKLEKAARERKLNLNIPEVLHEWYRTNAAGPLKNIAEYYNVFQDLFGHAYFLPILPIEICYETEDGEENILHRVYHGNILAPQETSKVPKVEYDCHKADLFTLIMTSPDGNLVNDDSECVHWLIGNIPANEISKGDILFDYIQPFPPQGIGYCRYIFILFKQEERLDYKKWKQTGCPTNLTERTFSTYKFYSEFQDNITPVGLSFFQASWDKSLSSFYQNVLKMKEPIFEYEFEPRELRPQLWFPHKRPFNLYMDEYKDEKELQRELLLEKLKERHPFKPPPIQRKYPLAYKIPHGTPSWLSDDIKLRRAREGKWKFM